MIGLESDKLFSKIYLQIPLETKAKEIWGAQPQRSECQEEDERTPLLAGGGGEGGMLAR